MLLNICIPLWNRGFDIKKLFENLDIINKKLDQTIITFEVYIGDFKSTDINLELEKSLYSFKINTVYIEGPFNISIGIIKAVELVKSGLLLITDADTVFDNDINLYALCNDITEGKTFFTPICSTESKPLLWSYLYDSIKQIYVPTVDHGGAGCVLCYLSDWKNANVFIGSDYLLERGQYWGGHDDKMSNDLRVNLSRIRYISDNIWTRPNIRTGKWYSINGGQFYVEKIKM
jgi:hypothetical protein